MIKKTLAPIIALFALGCIKDVGKPLPENMEQSSPDAGLETPSIPDLSQSDEDFCEPLNPKPPLHEVEGAPYMFGGCGHAYFFNDEGHWVDGPGLTAPFKVSGPDEIVVSFSEISDPYFHKLLRHDHYSMVLDLHGPWLSEPYERDLGLTVQLYDGRRGVLYQKHNQERNIMELKLFASGETRLITEGRLSDSVPFINDVRSKVVFHTEEGAGLINFNHPNGPQVEQLELPDFKWQPDPPSGINFRRDQILIDRLGRRLLHVKNGFNVIDNYIERTLAEATLYELENMEPIVHRSDNTAEMLTDESYLNVCLISDITFNGGCFVHQEMNELFALNGAHLILEGEQFGSEPRGQTLWIRRDGVNAVYSMENGNLLAEIPPYKLPQLNTEDHFLNSPNTTFWKDTFSSFLLIQRQDEDSPDLPSLYYLDLQNGQHHALVEPEFNAFIEGSPYHYSHQAFRVNTPTGEELRWYVKREGELKTMKIPIAMIQTDVNQWEVTDGRLFQMIEGEADQRTLEIYNAELAETRRYAIPRGYNSLGARAYSMNERSPGLILLSHPDLDRFHIGFLTSADELP